MERFVTFTLPLVICGVLPAIIVALLIADRFARYYN
jgi:hypothetical protein